MKRFLLVTLALALIIGLMLTGCSQPSAPAAKPAPAPAPTAAPAPAPAPAPTTAAPAPAPAPTVKSPVKPIELRVTHTNPPVHFIHAIMTEWGKKIEEQTGGKIKVSVYSGDVLSPAMDTYEALLNGVADVAFAPDGYSPARFPLQTAINMTGGIPSSEAGFRIRTEVTKRIPAIAEEHKLAHILWLVCNSPANVHTRSAIRTLGDFKGKQIRTPPDITSILKSLAGVPVAMSLTDTYLAIQKGIVEGVIVSDGALKSFRFAEVTKYSTMINLHTGTFYCVMNMEKWNSLPPDVQKVITDLNEWGGMEAAKRWDAEVIETLTWAKGMGHEFIYPPKEETDKILNQVKTGAIDPWAEGMEAKGKPAKAVVAELVKLVAEYKK